MSIPWSIIFKTFPWSILVWGNVILSLTIGWVGSELPRMHAMLTEQRRVNDHNILLRTELEEAYSEQKIIVEQQQELLAEVDRLYRERAQAAITDAITGLPNPANPDQEPVKV
jgi:hypothetical protein